MARTPAQRGRIGAWLVQARLARGFETQAEARREIERLTGWRIPQSQYAEWESGRRVPSEGALERLQGFYGAPAEATVTEASSEVAAAIDRQTEVLLAQNRLMAQLLGELRLTRAIPDPVDERMIDETAHELGFPPQEPDPQDPQVDAPSPATRFPR